MFWLGQDENGCGIVYGAQGYAPKRVSTHAIEYAIQSYSVISDAIAYTCQQDGHTFYVLSFPTADKTRVLDITNGLWHERAYMHQTAGTLHRHRAQCHTFFNRKNVVGDPTNGKIYALALDVYTDDGEYIKALRVCAPVWDQNDRTNVANHRLELDVEAGVGLATGQGSDHQMTLRWSDDGGHSWSNELSAGIGSVSVGGTGEYAKKVTSFTSKSKFVRARDGPLPRTKALGIAQTPPAAIPGLGNCLFGVHAGIALEDVRDQIGLELCQLWGLARLDFGCGGPCCVVPIGIVLYLVVSRCWMTIPFWSVIGSDTFRIYLAWWSPVCPFGRVHKISSSLPEVP